LVLLVKQTHSPPLLWPLERAPNRADSVSPFEIFPSPLPMQADGGMVLSQMPALKKAGWAFVFPRFFSVLGYFSGACRNGRRRPRFCFLSCARPYPRMKNLGLTSPPRARISSPSSHHRPPPGKPRPGGLRRSSFFFGTFFWRRICNPCPEQGYPFKPHLSRPSFSWLVPFLPFFGVPFPFFVAFPFLFLLTGTKYDCVATNACTRPPVLGLESWSLSVAPSVVELHRRSFLDAAAPGFPSDNHLSWDPNGRKPRCGRWPTFRWLPFFGPESVDAMVLIYLFSPCVVMISSSPDKPLFPS